MSKRYKAVNLTLDYDTIDYLKERCQGNMSATVRLLVIEAKQKEDSLESVLERLAKVEAEVKEDFRPYKERGGPPQGFEDEGDCVYARPFHQGFEDEG